MPILHCDTTASFFQGSIATDAADTRALTLNKRAINAFVKSIKPGLGKDFLFKIGKSTVGVR